MSEPRIGVVMFDAATDALSVCRAIELAGGAPVRLHPQTTVAPDLAGISVVLLPGGFSYGDYLRAGALAATQPIMRVLAEAVEAKEITVVGLGNGFQVLTEAGFLPGGFIANQRPGYHHDEVEFVIADNSTAITNAYDLGEQIRLIQKGAYMQYTASEAELQVLEDQGNVIMRAKASPAGSDIAGIRSADGLVFGLMARPESASREGADSGYPRQPRRRGVEGGDRE